MRIGSELMQDPVFQLLKLYSRPTHPLESALVSESFSPACADPRFPAQLAWVLSGVLKLECLGIWHWLCYLLLQLSSPDVLKESVIRSLLERSLRNSLPTVSLVPPAAADLMPSSAPIDTDDQIDFVLNHLRLPAQWLYDAYATRSRYDCDWALTHAVNSSVDVILRGEYDLIGRVLSHLDSIMLLGSTGFSNGTCTCWYTSDEVTKLKIKYSVMVSDMALVITGFIQEMTRQVPGLPTSFPAMSNTSASTAALPLAQDMRIMRTYQMARTCFNSLVGNELNA
ncbi:hypothetical protein LPJ53_006002 [Coemansia erecta]|uniref:Nuclear pore complex protein NUP96 C-terminal domain-containing protein n=1 Tax=Coemansia erecta TaxID=147472 RepID=A0A9W7XR81_9FUNG|nr:hypothetical protein LPJ53_006002 [Coemansia erecta]